jgi:hypothetical protein
MSRDTAGLVVGARGVVGDLASIAAGSARP